MHEGPQVADTPGRRPRHTLVGTAIAIDMPMTVESVVAYLGIILAGCVAVTIADSFAPGEIAARLRIAHCKAILTQVRCCRWNTVMNFLARHH